MITKCKHIYVYAPVYYELCAFSRDSYSCVTFCRLFVTAQRISAPRTSFCIHLCHILAKICHSSPSQTEILSLVLEMAPLQGLVAEKTNLVLEMAPLQGLVAEKWRLVLETAPLQGLEAGKLGLILETAPLQGLGARKQTPVVGMGKTGIPENCDCMGFLPEVGTRQVVRAFRLSSRGLP